MWAFDSFALGLRLFCRNWSAFFVLSHTSHRILEPSLLHLIHSSSSWWKLRKSLYSPHDRQMLHFLQRGHITRLFRPGFGAKSVRSEFDLQTIHLTICSDSECEIITSTKTKTWHSKKSWRSKLRSKMATVQTFSTRASSATSTMLYKWIHNPSGLCCCLGVGLESVDVSKPLRSFDGLPPFEWPRGW